MKNFITIGCINFLNIFLLVPLALADGPFGNVTDKGTQLYEEIMDVAVIICALAIAGACLGMFFNKIAKGWAIGIIVSALIIGSSLEIAQFLISK
ncbi:MAG: hypothetical protein K8R67_03965 [Desulfobacteraceae bacterium]|nr:hypothetical protein [Desulfobacteraceae bacterium]